MGLKKNFSSDLKDLVTSLKGERKELYLRKHHSPDKDRERKIRKDERKRSFEDY